MWHHGRRSLNSTEAKGMKSRLLVFVALCASLPGCFVAANRGVLERRLSEARVHVDAAPVCCEDFQEAPVIDLGYDEATLRFGTRYSPARWFGSHKSFFHIVRLPPGGNVDVYLKAQFNVYRKNGVPGSVGSEYLFAPSVSLLDGAMKVAHTIDHRPLCPSRGWSQQKSGLFLSLRVNTASYPYMVVWTSPETLASSTYVGNVRNPALASAAISAGSVGVGAGIGAAVVGNTARDVPHGPEGSALIGRMGPELVEHLSKQCAEPLRHFN
jgi:hypothetical protein